MRQESDRSQLFVIRMWTEQAEGQPLEYRGRIRHALSGETRHFRDWSTMVTFLVDQMEQWDESEVDDRPIK